MLLYVIVVQDKNSQRQNEARLLARLKRGEASAVKAWYQAYQSIVTNYVANKINHPADVEEIVQDTLINCLKHLPLFAGKSSIKTWMISIARHEIADYYRKQYAKKALQTIPLHQVIIGQVVGDASQVAKKVQQTLSQMRTDYRELLLLKYLDQKQVSTIACELGRSLKSVEADLFRAREDFKELYALADAN